MSADSAIAFPVSDAGTCFRADAGGLRVTLSDGRSRLLHPLWLRERLPDPRVLDPVTGQRLIEAADLPTDLALLSATPDGILRFSDGFETRLPDRCQDALFPPSPDITPVLWDGGFVPPEPVDFQAMQACNVTGMRANPPLALFLTHLARHGFAIVRNVPATMDGALDFARLIGPIRTTNWGGLADVRAIANAYDLTMTPRHLEPHSDNPYRNPTPGYILLHCLTNDATGGESTLVDGFQAAEHLRVTDPDAFETLATTDILFRYRDDNTLLEHHAPLIACDRSGRVRQVRYSNRTEMIYALPAVRLDRYYRARRALWTLIRPESPLTLRFKLAPGELLMMDNYRLLHGRAGYRLETGSRHMRQCYMDRDIVFSRRAGLNE
ncbi:TauD/TfdA family dioxygenase [Gluconacetobacter tumulicola]|uniref:Gamma-butyrobetaine,2-oxoglutarate dioxygenase n=1 Tax=Gluconacetobacter tumulicola TaxID=1017177 RepID=A0A7W4P847_9PROT|nr:TauD/TfdA family dioxygenase [Gluconacetobacter tumulicola]MBB2180629.1 gamma-butyrobetaine,2-oxoglutarate dioxygenase [Gluconacetobacter tumulicola]